MEIAIEIGTSYTSIFLSGSGIVLREPTVIAFLGDPKQKKVRAVGKLAAEMLGKTPERTTVVLPVVDGFIADGEACAILLKEFIKKILPESFIFLPKIKAILGVPTGLTVAERDTYEYVCDVAGISEVTIIENIILSAVGIDLPISTSCGGVIVNIGGGITEMAALSLSGVIAGCGVTIGGNMMDKAIIDLIMGKYGLKIGLTTARKVKHDIGSLFENDISKMTVMGSDVKTKNTGSAVVYASEICKVLKPYYLRIADAVESIINMCPPEIAGEIYKAGVSLVGGGSKILGAEELFSKRLNLSVYAAQDPCYAAVLGGGKLLNATQLLKDILTQK